MSKPDHFFFFTAALKAALALNLGTVAAGILSFSPVREHASFARIVADITV